MDAHQKDLTLTRVVLTSTIVIPNFIGNFLVCLVVLRLKAFRTLINFLLVHLAITDILVGLFALLHAILEFAIADKSVINIHICRLITNNHVVFMGVVGSYNTIIIVAILRYYGITKPSKSMLIRKTRALFWFIAIIWVLSLISLSPRIYADFSNDVVCVKIVAISKTIQISGGISIVARGIVIPVVTLTFTYRKIYSALLKRLNSASTRNTRQYAALKSAKLLGFVIVAFIICTVPYNLYAFIISILGYHQFSTNSFLEMLLFCVYISGSSVNPYLYWFHCKRFRRMTLKMINKLGRIQPKFQ